MAYGVTYRMLFTDRLGLSWRVDFLLKNGPSLADPIIIQTPGAEPLVIEWGKDENISTPIIESKCYITYMIDGSVGLPTPETFININEDDWLIEVYRGTPGSLYWKGFIKPDNNSYPWLHTPYPFTVNAVDFTFSKAINIDLNSGGILFYDFITLGNAINRSLFHSIGYDDPVLKILYSLRPTVLGSGQLPGNLYIHTDAFYDLEDGPQFAYDALTKILLSLRARMFYSNGAYWLQRLAEIGGATQDIVTISPDNLVGTLTSNTDTRKFLGAAPLDDLRYVGRTQLLRINPSIKQQDANYELKAINQIKNFDWRTSTSSPFTNWTGGNDGFYNRTGTGAVGDLYRLILPSSTDFDDLLLSDEIPVLPGQVVEINLKNQAFLTLSGTDPNEFKQDYTISSLFGVILIDLDDPGGSELYSMDSGGAWQQAPVQGSVIELQSTADDNKVSTLQIISRPIPTVEGVTNLAIRFVIWHTGINKTPSAGSTYYTWLYPVFARAYKNNYSNIKTKIESDKMYSYIPDTESPFFIDLVDNALSNTFYYNNGSAIVPLPNNNWDGKSIEERTARFMLDTYYTPTYIFEGTVLSNELSFNNSIQLRDFNDKVMTLLRDRYSVRDATHEIVCTEFNFPDTGSGNFTETPVIRS